MSTHANDLDTLLATPLHELADNGFSSRIMANVADIRLRQAKREAILSLVAVALLILIAALTPAGAALAHVAELLAGTPAVWLATFMLTISGVVYARIRT